MNIISVITAPLKKIYGANKSEDNKARPWQMEINDNSMSYKAMTAVFKGEDNIPRFVLNNGCPWAIVSSLVMILFPFFLLLSALFFISRAFYNLLDSITGFVEKMISNNKAASNLEVFNKYIEDLNENVLKEYWYVGFSIGDIQFSLKVYGEASVHYGELTNKDLLHAKSLVNNGRINSEEASFSVFNLFKYKYPEDYMERVLKIKPLRIEDTVFEKEAKRISEDIADERARKAKIKEKRELICKKIVDFWIKIQDVVLLLIVLGFMAGVTFGAVKINKHKEEIIEWVSSFSIYVNWSYLFLGVAAGLVVVFLLIHACKMNLSKKLLNLASNIINHLADHKWTKSLVKAVLSLLTPVIYFGAVVASIFKLVTMVLKSECPTTTIKRPKEIE